MEQFYNRDNIIVRRSVKSDVDALKDKIRESDRKEIWRSHHTTPEEALRRGLEKSIFCLTIQNGAPVAMFGINPETVLGYKAVVWMLATDGLDKIKVRFVRNNKRIINMMLDFYPYIYNYVDNENQKSIKWLKYLGAKFSEPKPFGKEQTLFRYFYFKRK